MGLKLIGPILEYHIMREDNEDKKMKKGYLD